MIAGYALVAYPDKWDNSGVMTFIINQQGRVQEKNIGPNTPKLASAMTASTTRTRPGNWLKYNPKFASLCWSPGRAQISAPF